MNGEMKKTFVKGDFIGVKEGTNTFVVSKNFNGENVKNAILKVTALGLYVAYINGKRVGENYLTPGFTPYNKILQVQEYDITSMICEGENTISLAVNHGWFAGRFGLEGKKNNYGEMAYVLADVVLTDNNDNITEVCTDTSWKSTESNIVFAGIYDGETIDYTRELHNLTTIKGDYSKDILVEQICEPVKNMERFPVRQVIKTPKGETVYDFGQNIAGVVQVKTDCAKEISLQFAEILDENGNFYIKNLRAATGSAKITTNGPMTTNFEFTYFGFRYVKIVSENVEPQDIVAVARYSDLKRTGEIEVSNEKLNRFIENTLWSQRDNFVDIPTDCPQRDERLGWTGDLNAFCYTASYTYDITAFIKKWLASLRADQREDGTLPVVSPDVIGFIGTMSMWCDCSIMVPYKMYLQYGDISFLKDNFEMMKKYLQARENTCENGLVAKGFEYGDWLALDSEECKENKVFGGTDIRYIGNVFYYHCLVLVAKIADILGENEVKEKCEQRAEKLLFDIRNEYVTPSGRIAISTITANVLALEFGISEESERERVAKDLNEKVVANNYHVTTGFIGTPYLLFALADNGYWETAEKVLLNEEFPGWIHEVNIGATTVWERWNSLLPDGSPNPDGMTSFNHYAYGSVVEFLWRRMAGIEKQDVAFKKVKIMPHPIEGVDCFSAKYLTPNGEIKVEYSKKNGVQNFNVEIPENIEGIFTLNGKTSFPLKTGLNSFKR